MVHGIRFRPRLDILEDRLTPSGGAVTATFESDFLEIRGDEESNCIEITSDCTAGGDITITGVGGTTVNGGPFYTFVFTFPVQAEIQMFGGDDSVTIDGLCMTGDLNINTGTGDDDLSLTNVHPGGRATIITDEGFDTVELFDVTTGSDLNFHTGKDDDTVELSAVLVGKNLTVQTDDGNDTVVVTDVTVASDAVFLGGAGDDDTFVGVGLFAGGKLEINEFELVA